MTLTVLLFLLPETKMYESMNGVTTSAMTEPDEIFQILEGTRQTKLPTSKLSIGLLDVTQCCHQLLTRYWLLVLQ